MIHHLHLVEPPAADLSIEAAGRALHEKLLAEAHEVIRAHRDLPSACEAMKQAVAAS